MVLNDGRVLSDVHLDELRARVIRERLLVVHLIDENAEISDPDATIIHREGSRVHLSFDPDKVSAADLISRVTSSHSTRDLFVENPSIERVIARIYQDSQ